MGGEGRAWDGNEIKDQERSKDCKKDVKNGPCRRHIIDAVSTTTGEGGGRNDDTAQFWEVVDTEN